MCKACGVDWLPNELLKLNNINKLLHNLFQFCLDTLTALIRNIKNDKGSLYACSVDFCKALDLIDKDTVFQVTWIGYRSKILRAPKA